MIAKSIAAMPLEIFTRDELRERTASQSGYPSGGPVSVDRFVPAQTCELYRPATEMGSVIGVDTAQGCATSVKLVYHSVRLPEGWALRADSAQHGEAPRARSSLRNWHAQILPSGKPSFWARARALTVCAVRKLVHWRRP